MILTAYSRLFELRDLLSALLLAFALIQPTSKRNVYYTPTIKSSASLRCAINLFLHFFPLTYPAEY